MPDSTGGIVVPTFKHGRTNTIPGLLAAWKRWGFIEGIHYVVGKKPPKSFRQPIIDPKDYEHVITFYNGSVAVIIQSAGVSRGRNGFRKDKSSEKLAEGEEDLLEHRTDGTDAFGTLYIGCEKFPYHDTFSLSMSGVL